LWAYGWEGEDITFSGATSAFVRGDALSFNFCPTCGNVSHWCGLRLDEQGRRRVAVNLRLTEPGPIADVPIRHFDGLDTWSSRPEDGRCVRDMWF
jgi:hypothetical protein